jgi:hypothetical protein
MAMFPYTLNVLRTAIYYDMFDYPLREDDVFSKIVYSDFTREDARGALEQLVKDGVLCESRSFYFLPGKEETVDRRLRMEEHAQGMWNMARRVTRFLVSKFPFVRAVFVSGTLSKGVTDDTSDIDFFIITEPGRLWLCRTTLVLFRQTVLLNRRKFFCTNYFLSEDHLEIEDKNLFTAIEIAHLKPVYNMEMYDRFMQANQWIAYFLPNYKFIANPFAPLPASGSLARTCLEWPLNNGLGNKLDLWLMKRMERFWAKKFKTLSGEKRDLMFRCRRYSSKNHVYDYQTILLDKYNKRLKSYDAEANNLILT